LARIAITSGSKVTAGGGGSQAGLPACGQPEDTERMVENRTRNVSTGCFNPAVCHDRVQRGASMKPMAKRLVIRALKAQGGLKVSAR
jgi:hypothetical protein